MNDKSRGVCVVSEPVKKSVVDVIENANLEIERLTGLKDDIEKATAEYVRRKVEGLKDYIEKATAEYARRKVENQ